MPAAWTGAVHAALRVENVVKTFSGLTALDGVSLDVSPGGIVGLIGPNGSGKSTLINAIAGLHRPDAGAIWMGARRIDGLPPYEVARCGIGRTFQTARLFKELSALENVVIAGLRKKGLGGRAEAQRCLDVMGIGDVRDYPAGNLSIGQQRLLELAMNLMADPDVWLMDEPVAGVHPRLRAQIADHIRRLRAGGKTFLIVEHDVPFVLGLCDRVVVLHLGRKIADGPAHDILQDKAVLDAYLGRRHVRDKPVGHHAS
jgi:ABC-type branched-subunit amino acid transport system ATPase component